ncbi:hypothetical protein GQR58_010286 [Nymphon striatum]|nr:hypothetical protein GQR58_010286 [Nymphon striatum]
MMVGMVGSHEKNNNNKKCILPSLHIGQAGIIKPDLEKVKLPEQSEFDVLYDFQRYFQKILRCCKKLIDETKEITIQTVVKDLTEFQRGQAYFWNIEHENLKNIDHLWCQMEQKVKNRFLQPASLKEMNHILLEGWRKSKQLIEKVELSTESSTDHASVLSEHLGYHFLTNNFVEVISLQIEASRLLPIAPYHVTKTLDLMKKPKNKNTQDISQEGDQRSAINGLSALSTHHCKRLPRTSDKNGTVQKTIFVAAILIECIHTSTSSP